MHEFSIVRSLLSQAVKIAAPLPPASIRCIFVSLGPLSGVEPVQVAQAFDEVKTDAGLSRCTLSIVEQKLLATCRDCGSSFEVVNFVFRCTKCSSSSVRITHGDEFVLLKLEVEEARALGFSG